MRRVRVDEVDELRRVRLAMLLDAPDAFASRHDDEAAQPDEFWQERAAIAAQSSQVATFQVVDGDRHVGSATGLRLDPGRAADLVAMWVDPQWRRRGIGRRLVEGVCRWAARQGSASIELDVRELNTGALDLYRGCGFEVIAGPHPAEAAPDLMELRMRRWLDVPPPGPVVRRLRRQGALVDQLEELPASDLRSLLLHVTRRRAAGLDPPRVLQARRDDATLAPVAVDGRALQLAGQRQTPIDVPQAAAYYRQALELTPAGHPQRPTLLRKGTELAWRAGKVDVDEAIRAYEEAMHQALENGDDHEAAWCMRRLYFQIGFRGDTVAARQLLDRGIELLEHLDGDPPELLAELYACRAEDEMLAGRTKGSLEWADRVFALPHSPSIELMALHIRGNGRCELGDLGGMDDLWDAVHRAEASAQGLDIAQSYSYLAEWVGLQEGPLRSLEMNQTQIEACEVRGMAGQAMWSIAESLWMLYDAGRWDEALERAGRAVAWAAQQEDSQMGSAALTYSARIQGHRGDLDAAAALVERYLPTARQIGDLQILAPALVTAAVVAGMQGDPATATERLREFDDTTRDGPTEYREFQLPEAIRVCRLLGDLELAEALAGSRPVFVQRIKNAMSSVGALLGEMRGDHAGAASAFEEAATAWEAWGDPFERAHALEGFARCSTAVARNAETDHAREASSAIFAELGVPIPTDRA